MISRVIKPARLWYLVPAVMLIIGHFVFFVNMLKFHEAIMESESQDLMRGIAIPGKSAFVGKNRGQVLEYKVFCAMVIVWPGR